jgi:hypothetical protein
VEEIVAVAVHWVAEHCLLEKVIPEPKLSTDDEDQFVLDPLITTATDVPAWPAPGETLVTTAVGGVFVPVPLKLTVIWLELSASVTVTWPLRLPLAVGTKLIQRLQLEFAGITPPQSSFAVKSPEAASLIGSETSW